MKPQSDEAIVPYLAVQMYAALKCLPPREYTVLALLYGWRDGQTRTWEEVGRFLGVSRERIRQLEARALQKLRYTTHIYRNRLIWGGSHEG
jgi:RNA polymerase primary sigma factor